MLPALKTRLFGAFQVVDKSMQPPNTQQTQQCAQPSHIDFAFGSDSSTFAGVHRFMVYRDHEPDPGDGTVIIRIAFASMACNPVQDIAISPGFLYTFHRLYAHLLFREAIAQVLEDIKN